MPSESEDKTEIEKIADRDLLAALDHPWKRQLVEDTVRCYPQLTVAEAIEILTAFGGL